MSNYQYKAVPKPLGIRIQELLQSLQVIRDSLTSVRQGKLHQIIPVYGQLRPLLSEKSKGNSPLLLDMARKMGLNLDFYCMSEAGNLPEDLKKGLLLHLAGFPTTLEQELPNQNSISIEKFLDYQIVAYSGRSYKTKDIIAFFANKAGGAHYSTYLPQDFAELLSFGLSGQPILVNALLQIAELIYRLGVKLIKSVADFKIHFLIFVPRQEIKESAYIFDSQYDKSQLIGMLAFAQFKLDEKIWKANHPNASPSILNGFVSGYAEDSNLKRVKEKTRQLLYDYAQEYAEQIIQEQVVERLQENALIKEIKKAQVNWYTPILQGVLSSAIFAFIIFLVIRISAPNSSIGILVQCFVAPDSCEIKVR